MKFKSIVLGAMFALSALGFSSAAQAEYPNKPITLISPYGAGGDSDLSARVWADFARKELGQPVLVVNKTGAGGLTGTMFAAKAKPDGYTLFLGQAGPTIMIPLMTNTGGLDLNSFDYLSRFILANPAVVVSADTPWNNLKEFQAAAQKDSGKFAFADPSSTSWMAIAFRGWMLGNDVNLKVIKYGTATEAVTSVIGKHSDITFAFPVSYMSMVEAGKAKLLAIGTKDERFPNAPTFEEQGYKGSYYGWSGIVIPKGAPQEIKDKLIAVTDKISQNPDFIKAVKNLGFVPDNTSGAAFKEAVQAQYDELHVVMKELGIIKK